MCNPHFLLRRGSGILPATDTSDQYSHSPVISEWDLIGTSSGQLCLETPGTNEKEGYHGGGVSLLVWGRDPHSR